MDLDSMKYNELRSLAKNVGLKANMKADKLIMALKQHYLQQEEHVEHQEGVRVVDTRDDHAVQHIIPGDGSKTNESVVDAMFVTKRRGKGAPTKRKMTETESDCDPRCLLSPPQDNVLSEASPNVLKESGAKKRRVSLKDAEKTVSPKKEQLSESKETLTAPRKDNGQKSAKVGKIPRHEGLLKRSRPYPITPNFKKLHEAQFNKMESIDSYVERKNKQIKTNKTAVKEPKREHVSRYSLFSPAPVRKPGADERRKTHVPTSKPKENEGARFRPSVLSTRRINVRFSEATKDNGHKASLVKTPARKSLQVLSSTPRRQTGEASKPNMSKAVLGSATKTPGTFVFNANASVHTPGTNKTTFDLKASLSRPLTYQPHKGKLKPFGEIKENSEANKSASKSHQNKYKQHQVQTREDRRTNQQRDRKQKKEGLLGTRRGLVLT